MKRKYTNRIFFAPDTGVSGGGGSSTSQVVPPNPAPGLASSSREGEGPQQQQQQGQQQGQQQQQQTNPFEGIDLEMLDDETRRRIETAQQSFATVANQQQQLQQQIAQQAQLARLYQSRYDQLVSQRGGPDQQQQQQRELTLQQELEQLYVQEGIAPDQAKIAARMQGQILEKNNDRLQKQFAQQFAPYAQSAVQAQAHQAFQEAASSDRLGMFRDRNISQRVWDRVNELATNGQQVDTGFIQNLGRIYMMEAIERGEVQIPTVNQGSQQQQQPQQQQSPFIPAPIPNQQQPMAGQASNVPMPVFGFPVAGPQQQATRFTFPGSGFMPTQPTPRSNGHQMDAETRAALTEVHGRWGFKPKGF